MNDRFMQAAIAEAKQGLQEGGIPIGSVLVIDDEIVARGHNQRVQKGSVILHAEMDCLEHKGRTAALITNTRYFTQHCHLVICAVVPCCCTVSRRS
jgi:tRNA(Arg) A34 adenosine deaminase TadA